MTNDVWKYFEENTLSHSAAHYLMTINELLNEQGYARVTDVARKLNITRGSCSISMKTLKKRGYVKEDSNKFLHLSDEGKRLADKVERNDELLEILFRDILGVSRDQARIDACKVEHLLSTETTLKLMAFIKFVNSGTKLTKQFISELGKHNIECPHDSSACNICDTICFLEE